MRAKASGQILDAAIVAASLALISYFHFFPLHFDFIAQDTFHVLLRRLYYVPVLYAAFRFGLKGGLITSLTVTALFLPHAASTMGGLMGTSVDNLFEVILYNVLGITTGLVVDSRRRQLHRYQEVLGLNKQIEDRESAIRQFQAYTKSILDSISSGVISSDTRGIIVTANPAACRLLSLPEEEVVAYPLKKIFAEHQELLQAAFLILDGNQKRATLETQLTTGEKRVTVAARFTPHKSQGLTMGVVITLEDLTEVKELTGQLQRAEKLSALGELVAGVAHEMRNPLGIIRASVQMVDQELRKPNRTQINNDVNELTNVMLQEIDRLNSVVGSLLDFGRPGESRPKPVDAAALLSDVVLLTRQLASQQLIEVVRLYPDQLPLIFADEDRMKQVFVNLITNAIQAMPDGGSLRVDAAARDGYLEVRLMDTGAGISEEEQKKIFDPFHTTRAEGSGLGLSIVHRIVDAHNGYITVESEEGEGSAFTVGLPLAGPAQSAGDKEAPSSAPPVKPL